MNGTNAKIFPSFVLNVEGVITGGMIVKSNEKTKEKEMVSLERERLWKIFAEGYEVIGNQIEEYFGGKEEIKKEGVKKEFHTFKELMVSGVDLIHKNILLEDAELKAIEKKRKEEETTQDKIKEKTGEMKEKMGKVKKSNFWD